MGPWLCERGVYLKGVFIGCYTAINLLQSYFEMSIYDSGFPDLQDLVSQHLFSILPFQARAFFQAAYNLAPIMFEPHYNFATLSDKVSTVFY